MTDRPEISDADIPQSISARFVAAKAVADVLGKGHPLETALSKQEQHSKLSGRDRAFARLIASTTCRRLGQIDGALKPFLKQTPPGFVMAVLRTACAQILFLGTPPHAAVGESVAVLKQRKTTQGYAGLTNAVLRRVTEKGPKLALAVAPQENIPHWLRRSWESAYGKPAMRKMALALLKDPPLDLTVKSDPEHWAKELDGIVLPNGSVRLPRIGDVTALSGFETGAWWAQDMAASLPVSILGNVSGKRVLDMCAAPGGKTLQLAHAGADVTAVDRAEARAARISENLTRTGLNATVVVADAAEYTSDTLFDVVLLDAPCSATGTYRRHPDVIHNKTLKDVKSLIVAQNTLLDAAAKLVKPGGEILYCTCSAQTEEGEDRISDFLTRWTDFRLNPILTETVSYMPESLSSEGYMRTNPHFLNDLGGIDGFFIARLVNSLKN